VTLFSGDGLFALRDLEPEVVISYYNGLKISPGDEYLANSISYQVDIFNPKVPNCEIFF